MLPFKGLISNLLFLRQSKLASKIDMVTRLMKFASEERRATAAPAT